MSVYMTEDEQLDVIKQWWRAHGKWVLAGLFILALGIITWQGWQHRKERVLSQSSQLYEQLLASVAQKHHKNIDALSNRLVESYPSTVYAKMAALMQARFAVEHKQWPLAEKKLQWIIKYTKTPSLQQLARLRLARVLLNQGQDKQAMHILATVNDHDYQALILDIQGDIAAHRKHYRQARADYQKAQDLMKQLNMSAPLIDIKLANLPSPQ